MRAAIVQYDIDMGLYQGKSFTSKLMPTEKYVGNASIKSLKDYCKRYGHSYERVTSPRLYPLHPTWERVGLWLDDEWFQRYDMICYADTDVFAMPWAPDIFEECNPLAFNRPPYQKLLNKTEITEADNPVWQEMGLELVRNGFQAGVWVLTKAARDDMRVLMQDYRNPKFDDDSYFLNYSVAMSGTPVQDLSPEFNVKWKPGDGFTGVYFSHAFGKSKYNHPNILQHQLKEIGLG